MDDHIRIQAPGFLGILDLQAGQSQLHNGRSPALVPFTVRFLQDGTSRSKLLQRPFLVYKNPWCSFIVCRRLPVLNWHKITWYELEMENTRLGILEPLGYKAEDKESQLWTNSRVKLFSSDINSYSTLGRKATEHWDHNPSLNCLLPCGPQRSKQPLDTLKSGDGSTCQVPHNPQSKDRHNANYDLELVLHVVSHEEGIKEEMLFTVKPMKSLRKKK